MAVQRRGYIFGVFFSSVLSVLFIILSVSTDSWVSSTIRSGGSSNTSNDDDSHVKYGMFGGVITLNVLATANVHTIYMTCVSDVSACAVSCKTERSAREAEVRALANRFRPNEACVAVTTVNESNPLAEPAVISYSIYVATLALVFLWLVLAVVAAGLALVNVVTNPTEPVVGLPGCLWCNAVTGVFGLIALLLFGIYWASSGLKDHLALTHVALGLFTPVSALGFSYWIQIAAVLCSVCNVSLLLIRTYLLEREPPPPEVKIDNHADGTIFLY